MNSQFLFCARIHETLETLPIIGVSQQEEGFVNSNWTLIMQLSSVMA